MLCIGYLISKRTHSHTSCESPSLWISLQHNIFPVNGLFPFFVFLALTRTKELLLPSTPSIQWTCSRYSCRQPTDLPFHLIFIRILQFGDENYPVSFYFLFFLISAPGMNEFLNRTCLESWFHFRMCVTGEKQWGCLKFQMRCCWPGAVTSWLTLRLNR